MPLVGPPRPTNGPVPSSDGVTEGVGVGDAGGSVVGTSVGATSGGAGLAVVMGLPFPPLFPGDVFVDDCGSARKLIRSGSTGCSLLANSEVNGYGMSSTRRSAAPMRTCRTSETTAGPESRRRPVVSARFGYGRLMRPACASVLSWLSVPPGSLFDPPAAAPPAVIARGDPRSSHDSFSALLAPPWRPKAHTDGAATGLVTMLTPGISTSTISPSSSLPTPAGVPVATISPGSSVMICEM